MLSSREPARFSKSEGTIMARGRMLSTTIATDKRLADLSLIEEYLFLKTVPHLDRDGLILGDASLLWAQVAPRRPNLLSETANAVIAWANADLIIAYDTPDGLALYFPGFAKNQVGFRYDREPASTIACPPGYVRTTAGLVPDGSQQSSGNLPDNFRQSSGNLPAEVKGIEVKEKGKEPPPPSSFESAAAGQAQAAKLQRLNDQVSPALRTPLANALLDVTGKRRLADVGGQEGDRLLYAAHEAAVTLYRMGIKSETDILAFEPLWREDWRGLSGGTVKQFLEFVSEQQSGKSRSNGNAPAEVLNSRPVSLDAMEVLR